MFVGVAEAVDPITKQVSKVNFVLRHEVRLSVEEAFRGVRGKEISGVHPARTVGGYEVELGGRNSW